MIARHFGAFTVKIEGILAYMTLRAADVYVSAYSFSNPFALGFFICSFNILHNSNKFVSQNALEAHVTLKDFQVCIANSSTQHSDQSETRFNSWLWNLDHFALSVTRI